MYGAFAELPIASAETLIGLFPGGIGSAETFGVPVLSVTAQINPVGISSIESVGLPEAVAYNPPILIGGTYHLIYEAEKGRLESITIKKHIRGVLYKDTFNFLYNDYELCSLEEAEALVEAFKEAHPPAPDPPLPPPALIPEIDGTFYLRHQARIGRLESVTIKEIRGTLYKDTFNFLYNEAELCTYEEALEIIEGLASEGFFFIDQPCYPLPGSSIYTTNKHKVGDSLVYYGPKGKTTPVVIKDVISVMNKRTLGFVHLYVDTLNGLWNEWELTKE